MAPINLLNKVLIADDDPAILRILEAHLKAGGYEVFSAANGKEALAAVQRYEPCYLITDWNMPEMDGVELCRRVRQLDLPGYVYIVFLTVRTTEDDLTAAMDAGADDFLNKPLRKDELMARLGAGARILRLESRLSQLATLDALTDLPTRRAFHVLLGKEWERSHRYRLPLSAVMIDIDFFKQVNDSLGHPAGDEVIRTVVQLLRRHSRKSDLLCRYGGEEFVALLPETNEAAAVIWAERFRQHVAEMSIPIGTTTVRVTVSLGVAEMLAEMEEKAELLSTVDQCLLAAKQRGRNRVESLQSLSASGSLSPATGLFGESVLEGIIARDAMIPLVCCIGPDWSIERATAYLLQYRMSSVPVTDAAGNLLGIISEKDILGIAHMPEAPDRRVSDVMRANVITYDVEAPLARVLSCFIRAPIRSVVITSQGKACGVISRAAVVRWFLENRWAVRLIQRGIREPSPSGDPRPASDPTLETLAHQLFEMAGELQRHLKGDPLALDAAPIVGGASRMQQLLEDLLSAAPRCESVRHGLPV
jgi:two-component system, cell cycle response regulator